MPVETNNNFWTWRPGRQGSGYEKMLVLGNPFLIPFDCYLLRYAAGSGIAEHTDPVNGKRHYRLNLVLKQARRGGAFSCSSPIFATGRIKLFRPDVAAHGVSRVEEGTRYVLSIGWVRQ